MISVRRNENELDFRQRLEIAIEESRNANDSRPFVPLDDNNVAVGSDEVSGARAIGVDSKDTIRRV